MSSLLADISLTADFEKVFSVALTGALLAAVALSFVYEKVVATSANGKTVVSIAGSATFVGSATFSSRRLNFAVGNRALPELGSFHIVYLISLCYHVEDCKPDFVVWSQ